jgi:hypothetical protein
MKFTRTNLTPGMVVLLILLAVLFAFIVVPLLIIGGFCWLVCQVFTGKSPLELYLRSKTHRHDRVYEGPYRQDPPGSDDDPPRSDDDTIECEVLSARTFDEDGQEIR